MTILISGLLLTVAASIAVSYIQEIQRFYIIAGILGAFVFAIMFVRPELGAYLLIITVFTNLSDILTESGLPSINQPLAAGLMLVVVANLIFAPERLVPLNKISRVELALLAYLLVAILSYSVVLNQDEAYVVIVRLVKNIVILFTIFMALNSRKKFRQAIRVLIVTMALLTFIGVIQYLSGSNFDAYFPH